MASKKQADEVTAVEGEPSARTQAKLAGTFGVAAPFETREAKPPVTSEDRIFDTPPARAAAKAAGTFGEFATTFKTRARHDHEPPEAGDEVPPQARTLAKVAGTFGVPVPFESRGGPNK